MLDSNLLRQDPAALALRLRETRGFELDAVALERLEADRKALQVRTQELQNLRNTRSKAIGQAKARGEDAAPLLAEVAGLGDELKASETRLEAIRSELEAIALGLPNLPDDSVPRGRDESANVESTAGAARAPSTSSARPRRPGARHGGSMPRRSAASAPVSPCSWTARALHRALGIHARPACVRTRHEETRAAAGDATRWGGTGSAQVRGRPVRDRGGRGRAASKRYLIPTAEVP